ncbi:hypothetical protein HKD24_05660 [Gluconobacter sp. LMG 31484]|uniref:Uncharacterized protein n=1 Tax=Gluconobacter vitians TaxID=2728102 RepID=A0ABR9Y445_9PROT|nr:hypothetical protein [Gluconobacter vitians]MBF0858699.1 hypothetical protein [Gluconobacter vitians]
MSLRDDLASVQKEIHVLDARQEQEYELRQKTQDLISALRKEFELVVSVDQEIEEFYREKISQGIMGGDAVSSLTLPDRLAHKKAKRDNLKEQLSAAENYLQKQEGEGKPTAERLSELKDELENTVHMLMAALASQRSERVTAAWDNYLKELIDLWGLTHVNFLQRPVYIPLGAQIYPQNAPMRADQRALSACMGSGINEQRLHAGYAGRLVAAQSQWGKVKEILKKDAYADVSAFCCELPVLGHPHERN